MRKMFSKQQLIEMIEAYSKASPEDIQKMFDDGEVSLSGMYVRIMKAPTSTTLTDKQEKAIREGCFIKGEFLNLINPVFFPLVSTYQYGLVIGKTTYDNATEIKTYQIQSNHTIRMWGNYAQIELRKLNGKELPNYSSNTEIGHYICRKGALQYYVPITQDNVTSGDVIDLTSDLGKALLDHLEVEINGHRCRFESEEGNYVVYSSFGEVSATGKLTANIISYNKSTREISFNQMTFTPDA